MDLKKIFYHNPIRLIWKVLAKAKLNRKDHKSICSSFGKPELISETVILWFCWYPDSVQHGGTELTQAPVTDLAVVRDIGHWDLKNQKPHSSLGKGTVLGSKTLQDLATTKLTSYTIAWRCCSLLFLKTATQAERKGQWTLFYKALCMKRQAELAQMQS